MVVSRVTGYRQILLAGLSLGAAAPLACASHAFFRGLVMCGRLLQFCYGWAFCSELRLLWPVLRTSSDPSPAHPLPAGYWLLGGAFLVLLGTAMPPRRRLDCFGVLLLLVRFLAGLRTFGLSKSCVDLVDLYFWMLGAGWFACATNPFGLF